jgi:serine/threonine protein kinase
MPASSSDTSHSSESDHGYFVESGDDDEGDVEIETEDKEKYQKGLYFPVCIGDYIADRYRIVHKLGHGAFSTVWLAHDANTKKDVALKIMIPGDAAEHELRMQKEIMQTVKDVSRLVLYTDAFFVRDDNDRDHRVLSFPVR